MGRKRPHAVNSRLGSLLTGVNAEVFLDGLGDFVTVLDTHYRILFQNRSLRDRIGDHAGKKCYQSYHQQDSVCEGCSAALTFKDGSRHVTEKCLGTPRGLLHAEVATSPLLDSAGNVAAVVEIARDITARVQSQRDLRASRQMLESIAHGITDSILLLSSDFKILWANDAAVASTGLPRDTLVGTSCHAATHHQEHPCAPPDNPCPVNDLLATGVPVTVEHVHYDGCGGRKIVEVTAYPVRNGGGAVTEFVHIAKDITQRKTLEGEREKLIAALQEALVKVKQLSGLLPICASCKRIRDDKGYWNQIEVFIRDHSDANFTHGLCPDCVEKLFEEFREE